MNRVVKEVMFNHSLLLNTPDDLLDSRAIDLGLLSPTQPILVLGTQSGLLQLFQTCSSKPWMQAHLKGSLVCVKIAKILSELRLIVVSLEGNFYIFNLFQLQEDYERERNERSSNEKENQVRSVGIVEEEDAEEIINQIDIDFESQFDINIHNGRRKQSSNNNNNIYRINKLSSEENKASRERGNSSSQGNMTAGFGSSSGLNQY